MRQLLLYAVVLFMLAAAECTTLPGPLRVIKELQSQQLYQNAVERGSKIDDTMADAQLPPPKPATIRVAVQYTYGENVTQQQKSMIEELTEATVRVIQQHIQVKVPVQDTLLVAPQYVTEDYCAAVNAYANETGFTCDGPGWTPDFTNPSIPRPDAKSPWLENVALLEAAYFLSPSCATSLNETTGEVTWDPACRRSSDMNKTALQTDFYLNVIVPGMFCSEDGSTTTLAYASFMFTDVTTNRPTMGFMAICPSAVDYNMAGQIVEIITHELIHALVMNQGLFPLFVDDNGKLLGVDKVMRQVTSPANDTSDTRTNTTYLVTPNVVEEAQQQFNCSSLIGAELSTADLSHWHLDIYQGDIMTNLYPNLDGSNVRISRVLLALFQDSGWYVTDINKGSYLSQFRNEGCSFPTLKCEAFMEKVPDQQYYCNDPSTQLSLTYCSANGITRQYCIGEPFAGYHQCPVYISPRARVPLNLNISWEDYPLSIRQANCMSPLFTNIMSADDPYGEEVRSSQAFGWSIGQRSRCVNVTLPLTSTNPPYTARILYNTSATPMEPVQDPAVQRYSAGQCWPAQCKDGKLYYRIKGKLVYCPAGKTVSLPQLVKGLSSGTITCPANPRAVCRTLACGGGRCSPEGGQCFEGECVCRIGYHGRRCDRRYYKTDPNSLGGEVLRPVMEGH